MKLREGASSSPDISPLSTEAVLGIRRNDLKPEVRAYADNLRDQVREIFADHGVKTVDEFSAAARQKKISFESVKNVRELLTQLRTVIETGEMPVIEVSEREQLQHWMQGAYDELGIKTEVPPPPEITQEQKEAFAQFGLRLLYIPTISPEEYPPSFVQVDALGFCNMADNKYRGYGKWVAVETIAKPNYTDPQGYLNDHLGQVVQLKKRFRVSWDNLHGHKGILHKVASHLHTEPDSVRLPTVGQWNFIANLFNWLREQKGETTLPDLGSSQSWEWTETPYGAGSTRVVGYGGLVVHAANDNNARYKHTGFRILVDFEYEK